MPFADPDGRRVGLVYLYRQGTSCPFAPAPGPERRRDNLLEIQVRDTSAASCPGEGPVALARRVGRSRDVSDRPMMVVRTDLGRLSFGTRPGRCSHLARPPVDRPVGGSGSVTSMLEIDSARVAEIGKYQVLVDPPRADLLALVEVAAQVAQVPMATINLITDTAQHQVAAYGFDAAVCAREDSMCNLVLDAGAPVVVPDASRDDRFTTTRSSRGSSVRSLLRHPPAGDPGGCRDRHALRVRHGPRELSAEQEHALVALADRVVDLLELELRTGELRRSNEALTAFAGQVSPTGATR